MEPEDTCASPWDAQRAQPKRVCAEGQHPPRLLSAEQAASYLSIPVAAFKRLAIGWVKLGNYIRYDRYAIDQWVDSVSGILHTTGSITETSVALESFERSVGLA